MDPLRHNWESRKAGCQVIVILLVVIGLFGWWKVRQEMGSDFSFAETKEDVQAGPTDAEVRAVIVPVVTFIQAEYRQLTAAEEACFAARRCAVLSSSREAGAVASTSEVAPCLAERLPLCRARYDAAKSARVPAEMPIRWPDVLFANAGAALAMADLAEQITQTYGTPTTLIHKGQRYRHVVEWGSAKSTEVEKRAATILAEEMAAREAGYQRLNHWLQALGVCISEVTCGVEKVAEGRFVSARFRQR